MYLVMHYAEALYYHNAYQINQVYYQTTVKHAHVHVRNGVIFNGYVTRVVSGCRLLVLPTALRPPAGVGVLGYHC